MTTVQDRNPTAITLANRLVQYRDEAAVRENSEHYHGIATFIGCVLIAIELRLQNKQACFMNASVNHKANNRTCHRSSIAIQRAI
jgi:hypothetical protein